MSHFLSWHPKGEVAGGASLTYREFFKGIGPFLTFPEQISVIERKLVVYNDNDGWGEKGGYQRTPTQDTPLPLLHITHLKTLVIAVQ